MNYTLLAYTIYLLATITVILRVGHLLYRSGRPFIINCLHGNAALADAVNRVLLTGYYLVNAGYTVLFLRVKIPPQSYAETAELLGKKVGGIVLLLGIIHVCNLILLLVSGHRRTLRELNAFHLKK
jgi:hypothetical protein